MAKKISVYPCGLKVGIKEVSINGMITAMCYRFGFIQYEISYGAGNELRTIWLREEEFELNEGASKQEIGFKK